MRIPERQNALVLNEAATSVHAVPVSNSIEGEEEIVIVLDKRFLLQTAGTIVKLVES